MYNHEITELIESACSANQVSQDVLCAKPDQLECEAPGGEAGAGYCGAWCGRAAAPVSPRPAAASVAARRSRPHQAAVVLHFPTILNKATIKNNFE